MSPHFDLDLEDSKSGFLHDTTVHDDVSSYHYDQKRLSCFLKIPSRQTSIDLSKLGCDLELEHSNPIFKLDTAAYDDVSAN